MGRRHSRFFAGSAVAFVLFFLPVLAKGQSGQREADLHFAKSYGQWLDQDVRWIVTDKERTEFGRLSTDQQRDEFIRAFWERRDPVPGSRENRFKEEHYRRLAYVNRHFEDQDPGWMTDRGRIYIVYGPPDEIQVRPISGDDHAGGVTFPYEVWHYKSASEAGKEVTWRFVDTCRCGEYRLMNDSY